MLSEVPLVVMKNETLKHESTWRNAWFEKGLQSNHTREMHHLLLTWCHIEFGCQKTYSVCASETIVIRVIQRARPGSCFTLLSTLSAQLSQFSHIKGDNDQNKPSNSQFKGMVSYTWQTSEVCLVKLHTTRLLCTNLKWFVWADFSPLESDMIMRSLHFRFLKQTQKNDLWVCLKWPIWWNASLLKYLAWTIKSTLIKRMATHTHTHYSADC